MDNNNIPNWALSSTGDGIALRWKALAASVVPILAYLLPLLGVHTPDLGGLVDAVSSIITAVWLIISGVAFAIGWLRQISYKKQSLGKYAR